MLANNDDGEDGAGVYGQAPTTPTGKGGKHPSVTPRAKGSLVGRLARGVAGVGWKGTKLLVGGRYRGMRGPVHAAC
jgi:hypothetical protein